MGSKSTVGINCRLQKAKMDLFTEKCWAIFRTVFGDFYLQNNFDSFERSNDEEWPAEREAEVGHKLLRE